MENKQNVKEIIESEAIIEEVSPRVETIRVFARTVKYDGGQFLAYSTMSKNGTKFYQVKFTQDVNEKNIPQESGYYKLTVDAEHVSIQKQPAKYKAKNYSDILWISDVLSCVRDVEYEKLKAIEKAEEINEMFNDFGE